MDTSIDIEQVHQLLPRKVDVSSVFHEVKEGWRKNPFKFANYFNYIHLH